MPTEYQSLEEQLGEELENFYIEAKALVLKVKHGPTRQMLDDDINAVTQEIQCLNDAATMNALHHGGAKEKRDADEAVEILQRDVAQVVGALRSDKSSWRLRMNKQIDTLIEMVNAAEEMVISSFEQEALVTWGEMKHKYGLEEGKRLG